MKRWSALLAATALVGSIALSAQADDRLKITGFVDNHIRATKNLSNNDDNLTDARISRAIGDEDETSLTARTRSRLFFNVEAFDNTKAVVAFEFDQTWGTREDDGATPGNADAGADFGIDNNAFELKWMYTDFKLPMLPVQMRAGLFSFNPTRLKDLTILTMDLAGVDALTTFSPQAKLLTWFAWTGEGFDGLEGGDGGDDYATGATVQLTPAKGIDVDLVFAFQRIECQIHNGEVPAGTTSGQSCPGATIRVHNANTVDIENRYFFGIDSRLKFGPFTLSPTFFYQLGQRRLINGNELDINAFLVDVRAKFQQGPFSIEGKFVYTPGNEARDGLTGVGNDDEINFFQHIAIDTVHRSVDWFETFGFDTDTTSEPIFGFNDSRSLRSNLGFDQFGLLHGAIKAGYQATDKVGATLAVGYFGAAEDVGRPARRGAAVLDTFNYTGRDKFIALEFDAVLSYKIFPRADVEVYFDYAVVGDALDLRDPVTGQIFESEDVIQGGTRMIYRF